MSIEITYTRQEDYNLPDLRLPEQDNRPIGVWKTVSEKPSQNSLLQSADILQAPRPSC